MMTAGNSLEALLSSGFEVVVPGGNVPSVLPAFPVAFPRRPAVFVMMAGRCSWR